MARFGILQEHSRQFCMLAQQLFYVVFKRELRVHQRPIVRRADKGEKCDQQLEFFAAKGDAQRVLGADGPRRLKKKHRGGSQQVIVV